jgi:hypothetical protein
MYQPIMCSKFTLEIKSEISLLQNEELPAADQQAVALDALRYEGEEIIITLLDICNKVGPTQRS